MLDQGKLSEYSNWKQRLDLHMEPIDLRMASIREARNAERRFCFEVITPQFKRVYQAPSEEDMHAWITALNNAIQSAVEGPTQPSHVKQSSPPPPTTHRDIGSVLTGKSSSYSGYHHQSPSSAQAANTVYRHRTVGARPTYIRTDSNSFEENPSKLLQIIREHDQGNRWCVDCNSESKVEWVSINLAIILCIECSGIHRSLGTHISKIRSLTLDTQSFTTDIVECLLQVGNRISNMVWESKLPLDIKPHGQTATRDQRLRFITAKYVDRAYITPISGNPQSHYATADETLLASIKKNDIQGVLYALANRANPNATDRSRNTHCVFLALAAADPATPTGASSTHPASPHSKQTSNTPLAFPIAEILVQNSAVIPQTLPAFPLSQNAHTYIDQRTGKANIPAGGVDTLGPLPNVTGRIETRDVSGGTGMGPALSGGGSGMSSGSHAKLQKKAGPTGMSMSMNMGNRLGGRSG